MKDMVFLMCKALSVEGPSPGPTPLLMKTGPATMHPVGFKSQKLAEAFIATRNLGPDVWTEPAIPVLRQHAKWFTGGLAVIFEDEVSIAKFDRSHDVIPLKKIEEEVQQSLSELSPVPAEQAQSEA